jgi:hypothetical protein
LIGDNNNNNNNNDNDNDNNSNNKPAVFTVTAISLVQDYRRRGGEAA